MHKYEQIANDIRKKIVEGEYPINSQLPYEKDIMEKYNVSRITAKRAYDILVEESLIVKIRGKGTFVKNMDENSALLFMQSRQFLGFSRNYRNHQIESEVTYFEVALPDDDVQSRLKLNENDWVYHFIRTRLKDGEPVVIEYTYMPMSLIPGVTKETVKKSIYEYIENELNLKIDNAHRIITARMPYDEEQKMLKLDDNIPVVKVEEITFLSNGQPFSYTENIHSSEHFAYASIATK